MICMSYSDSETTRLLAELITDRNKFYTIRMEMAWIVRNAPDLDDDVRDYYRKKLNLDRVDYIETLQ